MFGYHGDSNRAICLQAKRVVKTKRSGRPEAKKGWIRLLKAIWHVRSQNTHLFRETGSRRQQRIPCCLLWFAKFIWQLLELMWSAEELGELAVFQLCTFFHPPHLLQHPRNSTSNPVFPRFFPGSVSQFCQLSGQEQLIQPFLGIKHSKIWEVFIRFWCCVFPLRD